MKMNAAAKVIFFHSTGRGLCIYQHPFECFIQLIHRVSGSFPDLSVMEGWVKDNPLA